MDGRLHEWFSFMQVGRLHPLIGHEDPYGEQRYSSTLFLPSALEGGEGSASCPGHTLPQGKTRYPFYRRLGGPQGWSGQVWKISPPPGFDPWTIQPVGSRYTDYATWPLQLNVTFPKVVATKISRYLRVSDTVHNVCSFILFIPTSFVCTSQWRRFCEIMSLKKFMMLEQGVIVAEICKSRYSLRGFYDNNFEL